MPFPGMLAFRDAARRSLQGKSFPEGLLASRNCTRHVYSREQHWRQGYSASRCSKGSDHYESVAGLNSRKLALGPLLQYCASKRYWERIRSWAVERECGIYICMPGCNVRLIFSISGIPCSEHHVLLGTLVCTGKSLLGDEVLTHSKGLACPCCRGSILPLSRFTLSQKKKSLL